MAKYPAPKRRIIFAGEGRSEEALGNWLNDLIELKGTGSRLVVRPLTGGDPLACLMTTLKFLRAESLKGLRWQAAILLLDADRLDDGSLRSREAMEISARENVVVIKQRPMFEGVMLRLLGEGRSSLTLNRADTRNRLRQYWPTYDGPPSRFELSSRFTLADLRAAARIDPDLARLLEIVGLLAP